MGGESQYSICVGWVSKRSPALSAVEEAGEGTLFPTAMLLSTIWVKGKEGGNL